jgi:arylformamidase
MSAASVCDGDALPWRGMSATERERAYSPSSCIGGNYQPFIRAYVEQSRAARSQTEALGAAWHELRYGSAPAQRLDLCVPPGPSPAGGWPLLVFIHGGYWQELSAQHSLFAATGCVQAGLAFAAIDYTLAPQNTVAGIVQECRNAIQRIAAHGLSLGISADFITVTGSSAGAHLAAMVVLPQWRRGLPWRLRAAVLVSGVYDLRPLVGTSINDALGLDEAAAAAVSPALLGQADAAALRGFAPTLVVWGGVETEEFKRQSRSFAAQLRAAGGRCDTLEIGPRNHFDVILDLARPQSELGARALALARP